MKKIYLAGPDVFYPDALQRAQAHKALCSRYGFQPLHPLDKELKEASAIYASNINLLDQADAVLANLEPFRGAEPDSGTSFEVGYAIAKKLPVIAYKLSSPSLIATVEKHYSSVLYLPEQGHWIDKQGALVENFDLPVNLMLGSSCVLIPGELEMALQILQLHFFPI